MKKHSQEVEWIVTESDANWERLVAQSLPDGTPIIKRRLHRTWPFWSTVALLLVAVMSSGEWWWRSTQIRAQRMAAQPLDRIPLDSNAMVTNAQGNQRGLSAWYQFAHKVSGLPQIDALYATLRCNFGLALPSSQKKLPSDVSLTQAPGLVLSQPGTAEQMRVASPALYLAPVELTDDQLLAQSLALPLIDHLLVQVTMTYGLKPAWRPMRKGLFLWQLWDLDLPLAV